MSLIVSDVHTERKMKMKLYVSTGNKKLKSNDKVRFLIWNLPAVQTCPFRTALCEKNCYARKAEKQYPGCLPCRERNLELSKQDDFVDKMVELIRRRLRHKAYFGKKVLFRIHESGDFYSVEYAVKWVHIAILCPEVTFLAYTKSLPFFENIALPSNFIVRASIWSDTKPELLELSAKYPIYTALPKGTYDTIRNFQCKCEDCGTCQACYSPKVKNIIVDIH